MSRMENTECRMGAPWGTVELQVPALLTELQRQARRKAEPRAGVCGDREGRLAGSGDASQTSGPHCSSRTPGSRDMLSRRWGGKLYFIFGFCQIKRIWEIMRTVVLKHRLCQVGIGLFISNSIWVREEPQVCVHAHTHTLAHTLAAFPDQWLEEAWSSCLDSWKSAQGMWAPGQYSFIPSLGYLLSAYSASGMWSALGITWEHSRGGPSLHSTRIPGGYMADGNGGPAPSSPKPK